MKYRQPGYRDDEYRDERKRKEDHGPKGPRSPRGMDRDARVVMRCFQCGHQEPAAEAVATDAFCPKCRAAVHSCRNCVHFDSGARFECRQPIAKRIASKITSNKCELFRPETVLDATGRRIATSTPAEPGKAPISSGRAAFEALFKKK